MQRNYGSFEGGQHAEALFIFGASTPQNCESSFGAVDNAELDCN